MEAAGVVVVVVAAAAAAAVVVEEEGLGSKPFPPLPSTPILFHFNNLN